MLLIADELEHQLVPALCQRQTELPLEVGGGAIRSALHIDGHKGQRLAFGVLHRASHLGTAGKAGVVGIGKGYRIYSAWVIFLAKVVTDGGKVVLWGGDSVGF